MDSGKNISTRIMPEGSQQHHYKRIVVIIAVIFIVGILGVLAYEVFLYPTSHFFRITAKEQALLDQYHADIQARSIDQFKAAQAAVKPSKPLTADQVKSLQTLLASAKGKGYTLDQLAELSKSFQSRIDAQAKIDQQAYQDWKAQQGK
jgi:hypothetical protein